MLLLKMKYKIGPRIGAKNMSTMIKIRAISERNGLLMASISAQIHNRMGIKKSKIIAKTLASIMEVEIKCLKLRIKEELSMKYYYINPHTHNNKVAINNSTITLIHLVAFQKAGFLISARS